MTEYKIIW